MSRLAERVQRHRHSNTCYKYYKKGELRICRFDLKEENFWEESSIDPETGQIKLRCLDGLVNSFNMTILEAIRCNMDIEFIGSGESAKAMIYYITDYITKSQLKSHVAYAALQLAVKKYEAVEDIDDDFTVKPKRLLQKCAYALISHQEMSAQQVASYLMGYEDHFTSHRFSCLYWASFERFVECEDVVKLCPAYAVGGVCMEDDPKDQRPDSAGRSGNLPVAEGEGEDETHAEDEEVAIRFDHAGNIMALANQISDYTLRPREFEEMCLWDFVAKTEKTYSRGGKTHVQDEDSDNDVSGVEDEGDSELGDDVVRDGAGNRGGNVEMYKFLPGHKERDKKLL